MLRVALVAVLLSATSARADEPPEPHLAPEAQPATITFRDDTYAPHVLAADGVTAAVASSVLYFQESPILPKLETTVTWMFRVGAPLVHLAHRHPVRALASLALRYILPLAGGFLERQLDGSDGLGIAIGVIAAVAVDARYLALGEEHTRTIAPVIGVVGGGAIVGLGGGF